MQSNTSQLLISYIYISCYIVGVINKSKQMNIYVKTIKLDKSNILLN